MDTVQSRTKQAVKKGNILLFHWRGGYLTREVLKELLEIFDKEAQARDKRAMFLSTGRRPYCRHGLKMESARNRWKWKRQMKERRSSSGRRHLYVKKGFLGSL